MDFLKNPGVNIFQRYQAEGVIVGVGFDYTSAITSGQSTAMSNYDLSFQTIDAFIGFKFLDIFRISYAHSLSGKVSASDGVNRDVVHSFKLSLGILLNQKAYLEVSRVEKNSELVNNNPSDFQNVSLYNTYSITLAYPIELF